MRVLQVVLILSLVSCAPGMGEVRAQTKGKGKDAKLEFPPRLPGGKERMSESTPAWLEKPGHLARDVAVATTPPLVEFLYFPGQDYLGNPWSVWGESLFARGKYYAAIGDHLAPGGNAFVYEYDPATKILKRIVDLRKTLALPDGHYTPGKIHSRLDLADDGYLYFSTHRGSTRTTTDAFHYKGDWIMRHQPEKGVTEVVAQGPVGKHCLPVSVVDTKRLIFYGATQPGDIRMTGGKFFAYDLKNRKLLVEVEDGPARAIAWSRSTGKVYYTRRSDGKLMRYDPATGGEPQTIAGDIGIRAASMESPSGEIYTVSQGRAGERSTLYALDVKTEKVRPLGEASVGSQEYITALALDATGRYLYYCPGAHGGGEKDGSPVVQFDTKTNRRKVIAFLARHCQEKYGCQPRGTYSLALDDRGERLFITWNASRGSRAWDCCVLTVVHIPAEERKGSAERQGDS